MHVITTHTLHCPISGDLNPSYPWFHKATWQNRCWFHFCLQPAGFWVETRNYPRWILCCWLMQTGGQWYSRWLAVCPNQHVKFYDKLIFNMLWWLVYSGVSTHGVWRIPVLAGAAAKARGAYRKRLCSTSWSAEPVSLHDPPRINTIIYGLHLKADGTNKYRNVCPYSSLKAIVGRCHSRTCATSIRSFNWVRDSLGISNSVWDGAFIYVWSLIPLLCHVCSHDFAPICELSFVCSHICYHFHCFVTQAVVM